MKKHVRFIRTGDVSSVFCSDDQPAADKELAELFELLWLEVVVSEDFSRSFKGLRFRNPIEERAVLLGEPDLSQSLLKTDERALAAPEEFTLTAVAAFLERVDRNEVANGFRVELALLTSHIDVEPI